MQPYLQPLAGTPGVKPQLLGKGPQGGVPHMDLGFRGVLACLWQPAWDPISAGRWQAGVPPRERPLCCARTSGAARPRLGTHVPQEAHLSCWLLPWERKGDFLLHRGATPSQDTTLGLHAGHPRQLPCMGTGLGFMAPLGETRRLRRGETDSSDAWRSFPICPGIPRGFLRGTLQSRETGEQS